MEQTLWAERPSPGWDRICLLEGQVFLLRRHRCASRTKSTFGRVIHSAEERRAAEENRAGQAAQSPWNCVHRINIKKNSNRNTDTGVRPR